MIKMSEEQFNEALARARRIVEAWPVWKQNILRDSLCPAWDEPRERVLPVDCYGY